MPKEDKPVTPPAKYQLPNDLSVVEGVGGVEEEDDAVHQNPMDSKSDGGNMSLGGKEKSRTNSRAQRTKPVAIQEEDHFSHDNMYGTAGDVPEMYAGSPALQKVQNINARLL